VIQLPGSPEVLIPASLHSEKELLTGLLAVQQGLVSYSEIPETLRKNFHVK
jgi:hypothetical protein